MRVMAFGTFDNLHPGHLFYLASAGAMGDELIVVLARDENILKIKGHRPQENEAKRLQKLKQALKKLNLNGRAVLGNKADRLQVVRVYKPDIICLGYDQKTDIEALEKLFISECFFCKIKRAEPYFPEKYKSSFSRLNKS